MAVTDSPRLRLSMATARVSGSTDGGERIFLGEVSPERRDSPADVSNWGAPQPDTAATSSLRTRSASPKICRSPRSDPGVEQPQAAPARRPARRTGSRLACASQEYVERGATDDDRVRLLWRQLRPHRPPVETHSVRRKHPLPRWRPAGVSHRRTWRRRCPLTRRTASTAPSAGRSSPPSKMRTGTRTATGSMTSAPRTDRKAGQSGGGNVELGVRSGGQAPGWAMLIHIRAP